MSSRADLDPTPAELSAWLRVASPRTARGTYVWRPSEQEQTSRFGWAGARPLAAGAPADVELSFSFAAPNRWRIDGPDGWSASTDGARSVVMDSRGERRGGPLMVFGGPDALLLPSMRMPPLDGLDSARSGEVAADTFLGRRCWRWTQAQTSVWVDEASGCVLKTVGPEGERAFHSLELDVDLRPDDLGPIEDAAPDDERTGGREPRKTEAAPQPPVPFTVPWWPMGAPSHPVSGDPGIPELLVELQTRAGQAPTVRVGVAPAGRPAPTTPGWNEHRWQTDTTSFAVSWEGALSQHELDRLVQSIPPEWS